jgi:hypothetical protein
MNDPPPHGPVSTTDSARHPADRALVERALAHLDPEHRALVVLGRPDFTLTLASLAADGTGLDVGWTTGGHSRQRPLATTP